MRHREGHRSDRIGWLHAAVLGANDGIVSTASLVVGVALLLAGVGFIVLAAGGALTRSAAREETAGEAQTT